MSKLVVRSTMEEGMVGAEKIDSSNAEARASGSLYK